MKRTSKNQTVLRDRAEKLAAELADQEFKAAERKKEAYKTALVAKFELDELLLEFATSIETLKEYGQTQRQIQQELGLSKHLWSLLRETIKAAEVSEDEDEENSDDSQETDTEKTDNS